MLKTIWSCLTVAYMLLWLLGVTVGIGTCLILTVVGFVKLFI